jgi:NADH-quinone oxidoreductase subunit L
MLIPLYILAVFATLAGFLALSATHVSLDHWIDPVFGSNLYSDHLSTGSKWVLGTVDGVIAVIGVIVGLRLWIRKPEWPALEGSFLRYSWYINELYDTVFGRPSQRLAAFAATVVDPKVIDGGVNGVATLVRKSGTLVRKTQTGYVRNYVLAIVLGTVLVLAFMLTRLWWH